jgi:hypothetical protein
MSTIVDIRLLKVEVDVQERELGAWTELISHRIGTSKGLL